MGGLPDHRRSDTRQRVERRRPKGEPEHLIFFCEKCNTLVYDKVFDCKDIVQHFARAMEEFWAEEDWGLLI